MSRQKLHSLVWGKVYGQALLERGFVPMVQDNGRDMESCMAYTAAMGTMLVDEVVDIQEGVSLVLYSCSLLSLIFPKVCRLGNDFKDEINSLKNIVEGQRHLIDSLSSQVTYLRGQHNDLDFQVGGLRHWQDGAKGG